MTLKNGQPDSHPKKGAQGLKEDAKLLTSCEWLSSERYQAFVENIQEGVYEVDIHGNFLYFNNSLCKVFGYPKEEIQFQNFSKFMDEEHAKRAFETFNRIYETGQGVSDVVWKIIDKQGNERIVELSATLITNKEGKKIGFRGIARDITEKYKTQEALKKSEKRFRTFLDFIPYPVVVFTPDGKVTYLNPAFTEVFGWTLEELRGKTIPYVPPGLEKETSENIRRLFEEKVILRHETQRLTKDGRILDVVFRAAVYSETGDEPSGELVILRDITQEKRIARNNEALFKISLALPQYPDLDDLLDFISNQVKQLINAEGALVILLDEEKQEFCFKSAAHDNEAAEQKAKEVRFSCEKGVSGRVLRTGEPIFIEDVTKDPDFNIMVDRYTGFNTRSLIGVPLRSMDRFIGVLCAMNKKVGTFDKTDLELLNTIGSTVALSIENARFSEQLKQAYNEVSSLNRAKDKVINRLSHELKTPLSVLSASLSILEKRLSAIPREKWEKTLERAKRNLERVLEIQYQVEDIMREKKYKAHDMLLLLLEQCTDELESLIEENAGEKELVNRVRDRIEELFGPKESKPVNISLHQAVPRILEKIKGDMAHRDLDIITNINPSPLIYVPEDVLEKVVVGIVKNGVENTPDQGKLEITVGAKGKGTELIVRDYGIGITPDNQRHIFEGFFMTQETLNYSSKKPYDFNAGGKGADLLRIKIFSERYNFKINMTSARCIYIPQENDQCPGQISSCKYCKTKEDCYNSGGTTFVLYFPESPVQ